MLNLTTEQIQLGQKAPDKEQAIRLMAQRLARAGAVAEGYVDGMLARETQTSTYLGSGIAIPHGTTDTRNLVRQTRIEIAQFPEGIEWDNGERAYLVIAIAAKSDEHLALLRQLTTLLSNKQATARLCQTNSIDEAYAILTGSEKSETEYVSLVKLPVANFDELLLSAAARAKSAGLLNNAQLLPLLNDSPLHLGAGIWLARQRAIHNGWILATPAESLQHGATPVNGLLLLCAKDQNCEPQLNILANLAAADRLGALVFADGLNLFQASATGVAPVVAHDTASAIFTIINPHGLHARPGAMLVKVAKEFDAKIWVRNLDGSGEEVSAKSLMKVIALGVKCGHRLAFRAEGSDEVAALHAIEAAIVAGLGEGS